MNREEHTADRIIGITEPTWIVNRTLNHLEKNIGEGEVLVSVGRVDGIPGERRTLRPTALGTKRECKSESAVDFAYETECFERIAVSLFA